MAKLSILFLLPMILEAWPRISMRGPTLHFPIFDLSLADSWLGLTSICIFYMISILLMALDMFFVYACFLGGFLSLTLSLLSLDLGWHFRFLPAFTFFAFGVTRIYKDQIRTTNEERLPFAFLICSVYGFASFHKFINFHNTFLTIPKTLWEIGGKSLLPVCDSPNCHLLQTVAAIVVPVEAILAFTSLSARLFRVRLVLAIGFHWIVAWVAFNRVWSVSIAMLCLHLYLCCLEDPSTAKNLLKRLNWRSVLFLEIFCLGLLVLLQNGPFSGNWNASMFVAIATCMTQIPFWFLLFPFFRTNRKIENRVTFWFFVRRRNLQHDISLVILILILIGFGFSPNLLSEPYSVQSLGWTMFAAPPDNSKIYVMEAPNQEQYSFPYRGNVFRVLHLNGKIIYVSLRRNHLERLNRYFLKDNAKSGSAESSLELPIQELNWRDFFSSPIIAPQFSPGSKDSSS